MVGGSENGDGLRDGESTQKSGSEARIDGDKSAGESASGKRDAKSAGSASVAADAGRCGATKEW